MRPAPHLAFAWTLCPEPSAFYTALRAHSSEATLRDHCTEPGGPLPFQECTEQEAHGGSDCTLRELHLGAAQVFLRHLDPLLRPACHEQGAPHMYSSPANLYVMQQVNILRRSNGPSPRRAHPFELCMRASTRSGVSSRKDGVCIFLTTAISGSKRVCIQWVLLSWRC